MNLISFMLPAIKEFRASVYDMHLIISDASFQDVLTRFKICLRFCVASSLEMDMKKGIVLLLIVTEVAAFFVSPLYASESVFGIQRFEVKWEAPPFSLKSLDGNQIALNDLRGKPIMLTFWATWCGSCTDEIPVIDKFSAGKRNQLTILTAAIDGEREKKIERFVKGKKITLPVLLDVKEKIARTYRVTMIPTTFLIDRDGLIVGMIRGERDWSSQDAWPAIQEILSLR